MKWIMLFSLFLIVDSFEPAICINCKHFTKRFFDDNKYGKCNLFPREIVNWDHLVDGSSNQPVMDYFYCSTARQSENMCGTKGRFFEKTK